MTEPILLIAKPFTDHFRERLREEVAWLQKEHRKTPQLTTILLNQEDGPSVSYTNMIHRAAESVNFNLDKVKLSGMDTKQFELIDYVGSLSVKKECNGILIQLPLPDKIKDITHAALKAINPGKDIDGLHPENITKLYEKDKNRFEPSTPKGLLQLADYYGISRVGKKLVIVGRGKTVGDPLYLMLKEEGEATVTVCHSRTPDDVLREACIGADILVAATNQPQLITGDTIKEGAAVFDVGNFPDGKGGVVGCVDFESTKKKAGAITPVRGSIGAMTLNMLLYQTYVGACKQNNIEPRFTL